MVKAIGLIEIDGATRSSVPEYWAPYNLNKFDIRESYRKTGNKKSYKSTNWLSVRPGS